MHETRDRIRRDAATAMHIEQLARRFRREMGERIAELVRVPTENPPGAESQRCAEILSAQLRSLGLRPRPLRSARAGAPVIEATLGAADRLLYFHGHYDVVPAQHATQFVPRVRSGRLYGRGAGDMKGGLVAMAYAMRILALLGVKLRGGVRLVCVPDEETGGSHGSAHLTRVGRLGANGIGMLTAEPTGGLVWNANRGALSLRVTATGKPAHVGLHFRGVNAFHAMLDAAHDLRELGRRVAQRRTRYRIQPAAARRSVLLLGGQCGGGTNFNTVSACSWFSVDRRFNPEERLEAERARIDAILSRHRRHGRRLAVEVLQQGASAATPAGKPLGRALAAAVRSVRGRAPRFEMCPGLLETRFYAQRGLPAYAYGPGPFTVAHGPDEYVELDRVAECAVIYALTALRVLS